MWQRRLVRCRSSRGVQQSETPLQSLTVVVQVDNAELEACFLDCLCEPYKSQQQAGSGLRAPRKHAPRSLCSVAGWFVRRDGLMDLTSEKLLTPVSRAFCSALPAAPAGAAPGCHLSEAFCRCSSQECHWLVLVPKTLIVQ